MAVTSRDLIHHAISASLVRASSLKRAVDRLGFVQADPIRSPARAQDLILRHRVTDYRAGDLDRSYRRLGLEEDYLYAYGFMPRSTWRLLHPRAGRPLTTDEQSVLELVSRSEHVHPNALEKHLGAAREINAWGGFSKATTRTLERLHYLGLIRIHSRRNGVKLYASSTVDHDVIDPDERLRQLVLLIAAVFAPAPETSLRAVLRHLRRAAPQLEQRAGAVTKLLKSGELDSAEVNGVRYVWPAGRLIRREPAETVRFLAPFDPVVWDRVRFEQFWGWPYRFEAYTPPAKRLRGYYAMPLLWRADVVGWVNVAAKEGELVVEPGFVQGRPRERRFAVEFDAEVERLRAFLAARHAPADDAEPRLTKR